VTASSSTSSPSTSPMGTRRRPGCSLSASATWVALARVAGIVVVAATQKPSADLVPSALRDNFGYRMANRCATREASDTILGSGWSSEGYSASVIDPSVRGVGYLLAEGGVPHRMRTAHLDDSAIEEIVKEARRRRENRS
jgi:S-DNA-T family DNA segregation ATPase FtsK/SpoIIIE